MAKSTKVSVLSILNCSIVEKRKTGEILAAKVVS